MGSAQGETCPTCGYPVTIETSGEGTSYYVPDCIVEYREGDDGGGSSPPQPTDRPASRWVRFVGPWRKVR